MTPVFDMNDKLKRLLGLTQVFILFVFVCDVSHVILLPFFYQNIFKARGYGVNENIL